MAARALAVVVLLLALAPPANASFPGRNGRIAVAAARAGIVAISPAGGAPRILAESRAGMPRWSPDGKRIAFVAFVGARYEIRVAEADGGGVRTVPLPFQTLDPSWSPDGRRLLVSRVRGAREEGRDVYAVNLDGTGLRKLAGDALEGAWSPDGKRLAYVTVAGDGCRRLALARADGTRRTVLADRLPDGARCPTNPTRRDVLDVRGAVFTPDWRPDSGAIVYAIGKRAVEIDVATRRSRTLWGSTEARNVLWPRYSPDGRRLVFTDGAFASWTTWTATIGARERTRLAAGTSPDWQPRP